MVEALEKNNHYNITNQSGADVPTREVKIQIVPKLIEVFESTSRFKGAYGGRGSGKTRSFATMCVRMAIELAFQHQLTGSILCAREYMNSLTNSSMSEIKSAINRLKLEKYFHIGEKFIRTSNNKIQFLFMGLRKNIESIKSQAPIYICWIDEAETISSDSWQKLIPTIREEGSQIWVTWNPEFEGSATDDLFRKRLDVYRDRISELEEELKNEDLDILEQDRLYMELNRNKSHLADFSIIKLNWSDNPWFPAELEKERKRDLERDPLLYRHIWEGDYITQSRSAYYAKDLMEARNSDRIGHIPIDRYYHIYAFWDLGGTGNKADATAIWIVQFVNHEIRFVDYYEVRGQPLTSHVSWLRNNGYENAHMVLPHDGRTNDRIYDMSFESELNRLGFRVTVIKNQGAGAAMQRISASRKNFPRMFFNEKKTRSGIKALEWYQENWDAVRNIGLGPKHDWSSHAADAFGMVSIYYKEPEFNKNKRPRTNYRELKWNAL